MKILEHKVTIVCARTSANEEVKYGWQVTAEDSVYGIVLNSSSSLEKEAANILWQSFDCVLAHVHTRTQINKII